MRSSILWTAAIALALPSLAAAQRAERNRFEAMDSNHDGVITRAEWRGNDRSFREHDWNGDGRLSGDEIRPGATRAQGGDSRFSDLDTNQDGRVSRREWQGSATVFDALDTNRDGVLTRDEAIGTTGSSQDEFRSVDTNGDGVVTPDEWSWNRAAFDRLDTNHDGRLSPQEWRNEPAAPAPAQQSAAYRAGYDRGHTDGVQAGREDKPRHWDLEGQRELETADAGYQPAAGSHVEYQSGYRVGFRLGYAEGFGRDHR